MPGTPKSPAKRGKGAARSRHRKKRELPDRPSDPAAEHLDVMVKAVVFASPDGDFAILRAVIGDDEQVVLRGQLGGVHVGETLSCTGRFREHPVHGWGFNVDTAQVSQPQTIAGMIAYLASAVHGIGPVYAKAIVDTFGEHTFEMIDADPNVLFQVRTPGGAKMSAAKIRSVIDAWESAREVRRVMLFLTSHGVTPGIAANLHRHYGERTLTVLEHDPYAIVELRGIGFAIADRIARNLDVPLESPRRIQAGIVFCLQEAEGNGHCYLDRDGLVATAAEKLTLDDTSLIDRGLVDLAAEDRITIDADTDGEAQRIYLPIVYAIERRTARNAAQLAASAPNPDFMLPERPASGAFVPNDGQWKAITHAFTNRISLIAGLPGTGKTTLVRLLLDIVESQPQIRTANTALLASPTGKAARRMSEATGRPAQTLHRLLQWAPSQGGFLHDENNPLDAAMIIVDETSMVDLRLADALLRAVGPSTHLVLVGDADQLPPVGAGKVFDDLVASGVVPSVRLSEVFRQAARSLIVRNAHQIVHGRKPWRNASAATQELELAADDIDPDFFFVDRDEAETTASTIVEFAAQRIPKAYDLDPMRDIMVLAPMRRGPCGLETLNRLLQEQLNPRGTKLGVGTLRLGDRIIQTRNDYGIEVMNGEVGVIDGFDAESGNVHVDFGERDVTMATGDLASFLPAYAISVHRSQGSQAPAVVCAISTSHFVMLTRSLVNTAITRAQKLCVCVGQGRAMSIAVRTVDARKRNSHLSERVARSYRWMRAHPSDFATASDSAPTHSA